MSDRRVSIVIPTFNRAQYLGQTISSAVAQTVRCEVIVVDHGSTDATPDVVSKFGQHVQYVRREKDFGPFFCWLEGVLHATGDFVHLQFDDDWIKPAFIEECMSVMDDDCGFSFSGAEIYDEKSGHTKSLRHAPNMPKTGIYKTSEFESIVLGSMISPASAIFRRQILIDALYQGRLPLAERDDYHGAGPDYFASLLSMLRYPKVGYVAQDLAVFRAHAGSITIDAKTDKEKARRLAGAYDEVRRHYKELKALKTWRTVLARTLRK